MARLNDPPLAAESVDALKRRFVRQNRELARINSNQSVRIRSLENEISRLLSENIAFRERLIKLQHEVDRSPGQAAFDSIGILRNGLETKLAELSSVVKELGKVQIEPRRQSWRKSIQQSSLKRSPDQRNWKNALTLSEVTGAVDGRLPPIVEDKYYPRRTLENEELQRVLDSANALDSPDLGPPPVASWEEGDPVKNESVLVSPTRQWEPEITESIQMPSLANLETRKKRRESTQHSVPDRSRPSDLQPLQRAAHGESPPQSFKAGAKRKLNVLDADGDTEARKALENDDFPFNRKAEAENGSADKVTSAVTEKLTSLKISQARTANISKPPEKIKQTVPISSTKPRKALSAKSVNTDSLQSPAKLNKASGGDKLSDNKDNAHNKSEDRGRPAERLPNRKQERQPKEQELLDHSAPSTNLVTLQPETPAAPFLDLFSPQSSELSAARPDSRDTPPPPDLDPEASATNASGTAGRASRRPRGSVSYAEPSLREKMRRPTKELVDAVGADERPQILKVGEVKPASETEKSRIRTVIVKKETPGEKVDWKDLPVANGGGSHHSSTRAEPTSPLSNKGLATSTKDLPATVITDRRRRDLSGLSTDQQGEQDKPVSASGSTIAALVAGTQKARNRDMEPAAKEVRESKDIFELHSSSPADGAAVSTAAPTRTSRRHSSVSTNLDPKTGGAGANASLTRKRERRRESVVDVTREKDEHEARPKNTKNANGLAEAGMGKGERAAIRRRSMML